MCVVGAHRRRTLLLHRGTLETIRGCYPLDSHDVCLCPSLARLELHFPTSMGPGSLIARVYLHKSVEQTLEGSTIRVDGVERH